MADLPEQIRVQTVDEDALGLSRIKRPLRSSAMGLAKSSAVLLALAALQGCTLLKTLVYNFADLNDHRIFANRVVAAPDAPSPLPPAGPVQPSLAQMSIADENGVVQPIERYLDETRTVAFIVVHDDRIVYERYARGYDHRSLLNSFSIAKAVIATLVGIAVAEGRIASLDQTVADYRPEFADTAYGAVTLKSLLTMTSGVGDAPTFLPGAAQYYYGDDLHDVLERAVAATPQTRHWRYSEADVQMLGLVLEVAVGRPISEYLAEKLWKPLGMEFEARWSLDRNGGIEIAFCCISARARDFARLARLFLHDGRWNGQQIVPRRWALRSVLPAIAMRDGYRQRHLWWTPPGSEGDYLAYGYNGQYLYINPRAKTAIVKFSETKQQDPVPLFRTVVAALASPTEPGKND